MSKPYPARYLPDPGDRPAKPWAWWLIAGLVATLAVEWVLWG